MSESPNLLSNEKRKKLLIESMSKLTKSIENVVLSLSFTTNPSLYTPRHCFHATSYFPVFAFLHLDIAPPTLPSLLPSVPSFHAFYRIFFSIHLHRTFLLPHCGKPGRAREGGREGVSPSLYLIFFSINISLNTVSPILRALWLLCRRYRPVGSTSSSPSRREGGREGGRKGG